MEKPIIVGAGIAGLSLAIMFAKQGKKIPVATRLSRDNEFNGLLWLAPNGLAILERMGLKDKVYEKSLYSKSYEVFKYKL